VKYLSIKYYIAFGIVFLLAGCGSAPTKVDKASLQGIHTIAVVEVPQPRQYTVMNAGSIMGAMGAVGGAMMAMDAHKNEKGLLGAEARTKFNYSLTVTRDLISALRKDGYDVKLIRVKYTNPMKLLENPQAMIPSDVDAVLDTSIRDVGYKTENWAYSAYWRPAAFMEVRLTRKDGTSIYQEKFMYGYHNKFMSATDLDAPEMYHYKNKAAMEAASDSKLIHGLMDASQAIANSVQTQLSKN